MRPPHKYRHLRGSLGPESIPRHSRGASVDNGLEFTMQRMSIMRGRVASQELERCRENISKKLCK